jgi:hypothetical protein
MTTPKVRFSLLALMMGVAILGAAPAGAGSVTFRVEPKGEDARALRTGLTLYSMFQGFKDRKKNSAKIDQKGNGNSAAVGQSGSGNRTSVFQRGSGHTAEVSQSGNNNTLGVFQFGKNTSYSGSQTGGEFGLIFQGGW